MKTAFLIIFSCLGVHNAIAQKWTHHRFKLKGKYIAEVYAISKTEGQTDTALRQVLSFNKQLKGVEEVDEDGLQIRKAYNTDGSVKSITNYRYKAVTGHAKKTKFQYENGLVVAEMNYELIKNKWRKLDTRFIKYQFNKNGQVIQSTYSSENGEVYNNAFMTYDPGLNPKQLYYYDGNGNLMLPGCIEKKVVIENSVHHFDLYQYDSAGNVVRYSMTFDEENPSYQYHYRYNDKGQLIAYDYFNRSGFIKRYIYEYLPNGLISSRKDYEDPNQAEVSEIFLYKYVYRYK